MERKAALRRLVAAALVLLGIASVRDVRADALDRPVVVNFARPTCTEGRRGTTWTVYGATNVADSTAVCEKLANNTYSWVALDTAGGGGASWGGITGTLSAQTDLQSALDAKSATSHNHAGTYEPAGTVSTHAAAADPHTGYQRESERAAANGYASLDANTRVPTAQLGTGSADATTFLRGDGSWQVPAGGSADGPSFGRISTVDYTNATVTPSNITGLSFALDAASNYAFGCELFNAAAAATTGVRPGLTYSGTSAALRMTCLTPSSATAFAWFNVTASGSSCDATASQGTGVTVIQITGSIETINAGTLQLQGESEVAASAITIHRGSHCWLKKF